MIIALLLVGCQSVPAVEEEVSTNYDKIKPQMGSTMLTCFPRTTLLTLLKRQHREEPFMAGLSSAGALTELIASPSGSWTLLVGVPGTSLACVLSAGHTLRIKPFAMQKGEGT